MTWKAKIPLKIKIFTWLVFQNAILTKDNLSKRKWKSNISCAFCTEILFSKMLSSLKIILANGNGRLIFPVLSVLKMKMVSTYSLSAQWPNMFGVCWIILCRLNSLEQYWFWIHKILPLAPNLHAVGLPAVLWGIWCTRNEVCFDKKRVKSPTFRDILGSLLKEDLKEQVIQGAEVVKTTALLFHKQDLKSCPQEEHQLVPFVG
jgi:hypothetical protein